MNSTFYEFIKIIMAHLLLLFMIKAHNKSSYFLLIIKMLFCDILIENKRGFL